MAEKTNKANANVADEFSWPFGTKNYVALGVATLVIIVGYVLLGQGSITAAPILLVLGYCILIPIALIIKSDNHKSGPTPSDN
ncbi:MAG: hypothetical protein P1R58_03825 [bacterium]|nr:hypothetical protein [bacterium]